MNREVLQQALEFAEFVWRECSINDFAEEKRYVLENALRAELAKPEPEPVAWMYLDDAYFDGNEWKESHAVTTSEKVAKWKSGTDRKPTPLYALPATPTAPE